MKLLHRWARWILRDHIICLERFPYVAEFAPMKPRPSTLTFVRVNEQGKLKEAKNEDAYNKMMIQQHNEYIEIVLKRR